MNMWGFPTTGDGRPEYLKRLEEGFIEFFKTEVAQNPTTAEYIIPVHIGELLLAGEISVRVIETSDRWIGITYKEDIEIAVRSFDKLRQAGIYGDDLYGDLL